jgi:hypothetical protein
MYYLEYKTYMFTQVYVKILIIVDLLDYIIVIEGYTLKQILDESL